MANQDKYKIPNIQIGKNNYPGLAYGGLVYGLSANIGSNAEPTKININVALDTDVMQHSQAFNKREFDINKANLNLESPMDIYLQGTPVFYNVFTTGFNESIDTGGKTLNVEFTDGALLLDRIFVGLLHQHVNGRSGIGGSDEIFLPPNVANYPYQIKLDARCPEKIKQNIGGNRFVWVCNHNKMVIKKNVTVTRKLKSVNTAIDSPDAVAVRANTENIWSGGYIMIGREEFTEQSCSLKDVSYTFNDLVSGMRQFGINVDLTRYTSEPIHLTRSYTGTLRDVLQSWANDLGTTMYWDFNSKIPRISIVRHSHTTEVDKNIAKAAKKIEELDFSRPDFIVGNKTRGVTVNGTYSQAYSSIFATGPAAKNIQRKTTTPSTFVCEPLSTIAGPTGLYNGRSLVDIYNSCGLGKFSKELRDIYNTRRGMQIVKTCKSLREFDAKSAQYMPYFNAIGFRAIIPITFGPMIKSKAGRRLRDNIWTFNEAIGKAIVDQLDLLEELEKQKRQPGQKDHEVIPDKIEFFVGLFDENLKNYTEQLESEVANSYLGKHYTMQAPFSEVFDDSLCPYQKVIDNLTTKPSSEYYAHNEWYRNPIAKFIERIEDMRISFDENEYREKLQEVIKDLRKDIQYDCNKSFIKDARRSGFFYFERSSAVWATFDEDVKNLLNPFTLVLDDIFKDGTENVSGKLQYRSEDFTTRYRKNILKNYVPTNHPMSIVPTFYLNRKPTSPMEKELQKYAAFDMLNQGKSAGVKPVICIVKTEGKNCKVPVTQIGDLELDLGQSTYTDKDKKEGTSGSLKFRMKRNTLEELNSLKAYCDRVHDVYQKQLRNCKTTCEQDLMQTICKDCGELDEIAASSYENYIQGDKNGHIWCKSIGLRRKDPKKTVINLNDSTQREPLYSNTKNFKGNRREQNRTVDIIFPSEAPHNASLTYTRDRTTTDLGVRTVFDPINTTGKYGPVMPSSTSSTLKYVTKDISQAVLSAYSEEMGLVDGELPVMLMVDILVDKGQTRKIRELQHITGRSYHNLLKAHLHDMHAHKPKETYTYKIYIGSKDNKEDKKGKPHPLEALTEIQQFLNAAHGLASFGVGSDESGVFVDLSFTNNPLPKPELDAIYRKVGPLVMENSYKLATLSTL